MEDQEIQEVKNKKRSLKRYRNTLACIDRLDDKLKNLDERIKSVKAPNYSGMPRGGTPVTIEELIADKIDLEKRIERLKSKSRKLKDQILEEIDSLDDYRHSEILEAYFIERKTMGEIAKDMGYTERRIYDLYKTAVQKLTFNITK